MATISTQLCTMALCCRLFRLYWFWWPSCKITVTGADWKSSNSSNLDIFSDSVTTTAMELGERVLCGYRPFTPYQFQWPSSKVTLTGAVWKFLKTLKLTFSQTRWPLHSRNLTQRYAVTRIFRPYQFLWPFSSVTLWSEYFLHKCYLKSRGKFTLVASPQNLYYTLVHFCECTRIII